MASNYIDQLDELKLTIKERVTKMNGPIIYEIYSTLTKNVEYIKLCPLYIIVKEDIIRYVMYVSKLKFQDSQDEIDINQYFYRSSGTSREISELAGHWIPGGQYTDLPLPNVPKYAEDVVFKDIIKDRDEYTFKGKNLLEYDNIYCIPEVFYSRYVTKENAYVDKYMQNFKLKEIEDIFSRLDKIEVAPFLMDENYLKIPEQMKYCNVNGFFKL
jgi:hypothetical protein